MIDKLSAIVRYQLPEFLREEDFTGQNIFIAFIQEYYKQLEEQGNVEYFLQAYENNMHVDLADDDFLEEYIKEFAATFPKNILVSRDVLLKHIREFYLAKGSETALKFFFTILYNTEITVEYPRIWIQKSSSGTWDSSDYMYVTAVNSFKLNLYDDILTATIVGQSSGAAAVINQITEIYINNNLSLKLDISSYEGTFDVSEDVILNIDGKEIKESTIGLINSINILSGGNNYVEGDIVKIEGGSGYGSRGKVIEVTRGSFDTVEYVSGGTGYAVGDIVHAERTITGGHSFRGKVREVGPSGEIIRISIEDPGHNYKVRRNAVIKSTNGQGAVITLSGAKIGAIKKINVTQSGYGYLPTDTITVTAENPDGFYATLTANVEVIHNEPKRYIDANDFPSNYSKLTDSYYYQQFSYVIRSDVSPNNWRQHLMNIAHPAGAQLFGVYSIKSEEDISTSLSSRIQDIFTFMEKWLYNIDLSTEFTNFVNPVVKKFTIIADTCQLGQTLHDLEEDKFLDTYKNTIENFANVQIQDIPIICSVAENLAPNSKIRIGTDPFPSEL